jgi:acylphosphatase
MPEELRPTPGDAPGPTLSLHYDIHVFGRVQGVWFRASAMAEALRLSLHGFVRNEEDGSVYAEAEGPKEALDRFVAWCRRGPARAQVEKVIAAESPLRNFRGFHIR